ncbi:Calcium-binding EF-hand family protein, putative [Theobroma cacao]|uniref:Calcium-binding EF-hand family protein, putative n=1 Tax=Theobroma cacao TaxID=3641 RepID=A0A061DZQ6_THECC|nr:Calcium-binding EF-hand family protein, putative [Theobroma cacao]
MSNVSFLEFQYKLSKNKFFPKPSRLFSRDRQNLGLLPASQPDLNELREVFNKLDSNKDGKISQVEYKAMLRALGQGNTTRDVPKIFQVADIDGDGFINFKDFVEVQRRSEEVMEILRRLGERCTIQDCQKMVAAVDTDGDGMVGMDEFMTMMTRTMKLD